ncbi:odorant receptor 4-like [Harpegnathos saltator]|uniref:odorant receptor 4-like n=1 Tax=Harpegnathos saltator TaxID=610380 RepID=UPI000DBEDC85|nr:odorant receptor 4-like [Harpegnathos saltator]
MLISAKRSRWISILSSTFTYLLLITFTTMSVWNNMQHSFEVKLYGMPFPTIFPYNCNKSPNFELTWLGETIGAIIVANGYSCFDTFLAMLTLHLCGQLAVLNINMRNLVDATRHDDFVNFQERLGLIVHRHEELHRYATVVEDYFNIALLAQTLVGTVTFCISVYRLITNRDQGVADLMYFVIQVLYTTIHFFFYCYIGEQLLAESTNVAQSAFDCEWYDLPPRKAISLTIIIMRANTSFKLTAGKFSPFSFELFSTILKTSAGYVSVLLAMNDKVTEQ